MTMPKWHEFMRPVLSGLNEVDSTMTFGDIRSQMIGFFDLTEEEQSERLKSGQLRLNNRIHWAINDLEKASLLAYGEKRGTYRITDEGRMFLSRHEGPFTDRDLVMECPSFREWRDGGSSGRKCADDQSSMSEKEMRQASPLELMESSYGELREALAVELLDLVTGKDPYFFEYLVGKLLVAMGYGESVEASAMVTKKSGDEGIDGIVKEDKFGFDTIYYQAKRWDPNETVGRPDIQNFVGALSARGASRGLFITTARFTQTAREYVERLQAQKVVLVDGMTLASLMIDYGVGVSVQSVYEVKTVDSDFFEEG